MQIVEEFPFEVRDIPHVWIPMPDGVRLSARIWRPNTETPLPAILEFLPYRKRDGTAERDALTHPYMAGHGYVCVRVDMRGCGDSEGLFDDEYSVQELADGVAVIEWLASQSWCSGDVGMMGISWGGFNGLQVAALAPKPLKAVVSICSTVDRFADDIHYKGGTMLGENVGWAATVLGWFALPPDPEIVGKNWRDIWLNRLENTPALAETWLQHQTRDAYWKHGSVCENYGAIRAAVLGVGGWHDGYRNTVAHLVKNLEAPVKGVIGPWNHKYPHFAVPGPRIDFLGEMLRWWDRWLKGIENGVEELPDMRQWLMESLPPQSSYDVRPGRWIGDKKLTLQPVVERWHLVQCELSAKSEKTGRTIFPALFCGQAAGEYFPHGGCAELPDDQSVDDALSCCFDLPPLDGPKNIVGAPRFCLILKSDKPKAQLAVRLCDVHPDGKSTLITHGVLNLRNRNGFEVLEDLPVDVPVEATILLDQCAYSVPKGHRIRLAVSSSYWPYIWPEAEQVELVIEQGSLELPVRETRDEQAPVFDEPRGAPPRPIHRATEASSTRKLIRDPDATQLVLEVEGDTGKVEDLNTGLIMGTRCRERFSVVDNEPCSATSSFKWHRTMQRDNWSIEVFAEMSMKADGDVFWVSSSLLTLEGGKQVFEKAWETKIPRM